MPQRRVKWTKRADKCLQQEIAMSGEFIDWTEIALKVSTIGKERSAEQCKRRWNNQLKPSLNTEKMGLEEKRQLFKAFMQNGRKWKLIAQSFEGRTDNSIKNLFFSMIKKGFRRMARFFGITRQTSLISKIKPVVLLEIVEIDFKDKESGRLVKALDIVEVFSLSSFDDLSNKVSDSYIQIAKQCLKIVFKFSRKFYKQRNTEIDSFLLDSDKPLSKKAISEHSSETSNKMSSRSSLSLIKDHKEQPDLGFQSFMNERDNHHDMENLVNNGQIPELLFKMQGNLENMWNALKENNIIEDYEQRENTLKFIKNFTGTWELDYALWKSSFNKENKEKNDQESDSHKQERKDSYY